MIKIIEVECYFVVLNFNSIMRILFDILNIFHAIYSYKCTVVLKFCTQLAFPEVDEWTGDEC